MAFRERGLPEEEIRRFIRSFAEITGALVSFVDARQDHRPITAGAGSFCMKVRGTRLGDSRCQGSIQSALERSRAEGEPVFDLCHARMGRMVCPITANGQDFGHVVVCQALLEGITEEHRDHIRSLASDMGMENPESLVFAAGQNPVFSRSSLEKLGRFVQEQVVEKIINREAEEGATLYLMEKYEELMFLYAITENLSPDREYRRSLSVILDRGLQKLSADSGFFILPSAEGSLSPDAYELHGETYWEDGPEALPEELVEMANECAGPALLFPKGIETGGKGNPGSILVYPFKIRSFSNGYLVFSWRNIERLDDGGMKFVLALANQASSLLHGAYLYKELADLLFSTLEALSSAIDAKDPYTRGHSQRVAEYALMMANVMGYDSKFLTMLKITGMLHDFGKIGIRETILGKESLLNTEERQVMEDHPVIGARILEKFRSFAHIVPGIRHHHERYDGKGYPDGLEGEEIPILGRIISIADAFDAMTTRRPYREQMDLEQAKGERRNNSGTQFDPTLVDAFVTALDQRDFNDS
jgi:putative nucleotidyltransferase with HDIG domain